MIHLNRSTRKEQERKKVLRPILVCMIVVAMTLVFTSVIFAAPGGAPAAHGVDGKMFGGLVNDLAHTYPGAVADHLHP